MFLIPNSRNELLTSNKKKCMDIQIFENEQFGQLRGMTIEGEPWFVGKDVAQVLGYKDASKAVCDRVDKEDKTTLPIQQCGSNYKSQTTFINESGLYSLILSSKLPKAREFKRWVTAEVLPQIRRTGGYIVHLPFTDLQCTIRSYSFFS